MHRFICEDINVTIETNPHLWMSLLKNKLKIFLGINSFFILIKLLKSINYDENVNYTLKLCENIL